MLHYLPAFTVTRRQLQRTVCGVFIDVSHHSNEPDCPTCADWLTRMAKEDEETAEALVKEFPEFEGKL